jgi:hypothetical protein
MHTTFKLVLATVTGASLSLLAAPSAVMADDVPDALSGRKGHTEDRYRYWRVCGRSANSMA